MRGVPYGFLGIRPRHTVVVTHPLRAAAASNFPIVELQPPAGTHIYVTSMTWAETTVTTPDVRFGVATATGIASSSSTVNPLNGVYAGSPTVSQPTASTVIVTGLNTSNPLDGTSGYIHKNASSNVEVNLFDGAPGLFVPGGKFFIVTTDIQNVQLAPTISFVEFDVGTT